MCSGFLGHAGTTTSVPLMAYWAQSAIPWWTWIFQARLAHLCLWNQTCLHTQRSGAECGCAVSGGTGNALAGLLDESGDTCPLAGLASLRTLNIGTNEIEEVEELAPLATLRGVQHLTIEDNPCAEEHRCKAYIKQ